MKYLAEKLLVLIICALSLYGTELTYQVLAGGLLSLSAAFFCQAAEKRKTPRAVCELCYGAAAFVFPEMSFFAAIPLYEAARVKDAAGIGVIILGAVRGLFLFGSPRHIPFAACVLSMYLAFCAAFSERQRIKLIESRDDSVELERLLKRRNRELKENMEYELKINILNERNRIAREIHDNVGHILSRSLLSTGALIAVCPKEEKELKAGLVLLKENLNSAMESVRKSVHDIRDDSLDLKVVIDKMTFDLQKRFKTEIMYDISEEIPPKIKIAFTAILKEAVSNILRHSNGNRVQITVREHPALYQLIVYDNGSGGKAFGGEKGAIMETEMGMGLDDMRQRAEDLNGIFRIDSEKGFTVFVSVKK